MPWQDKLTSWNNRLSFLHNNEKCSDCCFIISEGKKTVRIPSHKFVLAAASKEFENLFYLMQAGSSEIHVSNFSIAEFQNFISFIYTDSLHYIDPWGLLKIANYYAVTSLEKHCFKKIAHDPKIFQTPSFLQIDRDSLEKVLKIDTLKTVEIDIYKAVNLWSENFCNQNNQQITSQNKRSAIGSALKFIRFGVMRTDEFFQCSEDKNCILNGEEKLNIFKCISSSGKFKCGFSSEKRKPPQYY